jgi:hypothetical protein
MANKPFAPLTGYTARGRGEAFFSHIGPLPEHLGKFDRLFLVDHSLPVILESSHSFARMSYKQVQCEKVISLSLIFWNLSFFRQQYNFLFLYHLSSPGVRAIPATSCGFPISIPAPLNM